MISGGGVFTPDNKLLGIMSYFQIDDDGTVYENGCASIEYYRDWIQLIKILQGELMLQEFLVLIMLLCILIWDGEE